MTITTAWQLGAVASAWEGAKSACAAVFHTAAPSAFGEMVAPKRWIDIGILAAVLIFMSLLPGYVFDASALA